MPLVELQLLSLVERNSGRLVADGSCLQEGFGVLAAVCFNDKRTNHPLEPQCHYLPCTADSGDLFLRPENVEFSERDTVVTRLN